MIIGGFTVTDVVPNRIFAAKKPGGKGAIEDNCRLRISLHELPAPQERYAESVEESYADMVLLPVHLGFGKVRAPRYMDRGVPNAARNATHRERRVTDKWQRFQGIQNLLIPFRGRLAAAAEVHVHREDMLAIQPGVELA